jgi:hypothetical protein
LDPIPFSHLPVESEVHCLWRLRPRNESRVGLHYKGKITGMIQPPKQPLD